MGCTFSTSGFSISGVRLAFQSASVELQNLHRIGEQERSESHCHRHAGKMCRQPSHLQCVSSGRPACCSCQRARHLGCTRRGHKQGLIIVSFPASPVESSRHIQQTSCSSCKSVGEWVSDCSTQVLVGVQTKLAHIRHVGAMQFPKFHSYHFHCLGLHHVNVESGE